MAMSRMTQLQDASVAIEKLKHKLKSVENQRKNMLDNKKHKHTFFGGELFAILLVFLADTSSGVFFGVMLHRLFFEEREGLALVCFSVFGLCVGLYSFFRGQYKRVNCRN